MPSKINCYFIILVCYCLYRGFNVTVGGWSFSMFDWQKYSFTTEFARKIITNLKMKLKSRLLFPVWIVNRMRS